MAEEQGPHIPDLVDQLEISWMILADSAQVVSGKLYLLGGGWTRLTVNNPQVTRRAAIAVAVKVPWRETNRQHSLEIAIKSIDEQPVGQAKAGFEIGRPPGIAPGSSQLIQIAVEVELALPHLGQYLIVGVLNGTEMKRYLFEVVPGPRYQQSQPNPPKAS